VYASPVPDELLRLQCGLDRCDNEQAADVAFVAVMPSAQGIAATTRRSIARA
jgi:hypothetical protein